MIHEGSPVTRLSEDGAASVVHTSHGSVRAARVALATNAFPPLLRRLRLMTVPVYDYVLMTEPLSSAQLASIGWAGREGVGDAANQFHYYRLTRDNRILWGGYDAVYYLGSQISHAREQSPVTHRLLAAQFFETFPQLAGLRFSASLGRRHRHLHPVHCLLRYGARAAGSAYALGYTGLGVAATRFGADVMLDLLHGESSERTALSMVRSQAAAVPAGAVRATPASTLTRWSIDRPTGNAGRRNLWLRTLDRLGLGFDS